MGVGCTLNVCAGDSVSSYPEKGRCINKRCILEIDKGKPQPFHLLNVIASQSFNLLWVRHHL